MSNDETQPTTITADEDATMAPVTVAPPTAPAAMATGNRKRPRLDLTVEAGKDAESAQGRERKRGKSMFGLLLGTLNKAKVEDSERSKSEAAKKRQLTEQRLQDRLRKETDSVRRAEEVKKDKTNANRKEEDLQLKDSIHKLRHIQLPLLANFLSTADHIPSSTSSGDLSDEAPSSSKNPLAPLAKTHPPPLYYLPTILTPAQEAFLTKRKAEVTEAVAKEWQVFRDERTAGIDEILKLRERVVEEDARKKSEQQLKNNQNTPNGEDVKMEEEDTTKEKKDEGGGQPESTKKEESTMDVDDEPKSAPPSATEPKSATDPSSEMKVTPVAAKREAMQTDEDDAVEY